MLIRYTIRAIIGGMAEVGRIKPKYAIGFAPPPRNGELSASAGRGAEIAALAGRQHGVVSRAQLLALGVSASLVQAWISAARLHAVYAGVYAVGHTRLGREGRWMAAVLACGPEAALSHRSAAALLGLRQTDRAAIDVTTPRRTGRARAAIDMHRSRALFTSDVTLVCGVPCTTVARTLLDLADVTDQRALERACEQAEVLRLLDHRHIEDVLRRGRGRHATSLLRSTLADLHAGETITRSELEEQFLSLCAVQNLPPPSVNSTITLNDHECLEVDFLWPAHHLIVETDGFATHRTRQAFEHDRARDQRLLAAGWRVIRCTWRQVNERPHELTALLRRLLSDQRAPPSRFR